MPVMSGLQAAKLIKSRWPEIKVLVLTLSKTECLAQDPAEVDALLVKGGPVEKLWEALLSSDV
jgi:DNA-binding NarL/FixJ family response regulator